MKNTKYIMYNIMIGSIYVAVSLVIPFIQFSSMQFRIAEIMNIFPLFSKRYIPGVTLGCIITNFIGAYMGVNVLGYLDIFVGGLATFISLYLVYLFRKIKICNLPILSVMMPVVINALFIGAELAYVFMPNEFYLGLLINGFQIFVSQFIVCVILGLLLYNKLKDKKFIYKIEEKEKNG